MKTFIQKSFIVFGMAFLFMVMVGDLFHVGDNIVNDNSVIESSKNYNGYFSLWNERELIRMSDYFEDLYYYDTYIPQYYIDSDWISKGYAEYVFFNITFDDTNLTAQTATILRIQVNGNIGKVTFTYYDVLGIQHFYDYDGYYFYTSFYGRSNYEVK